MRMSCNGCRVLRKGCSPSCRLRPCLQWIRNPDSQANATLFLAKFYGRAGLLNLVTAGPDHLRPAIFRSLLYEACGRIVNPIYGSVGLLWSGSWQLCQDAVEAVLRGSPVDRISTAVPVPLPLLKAFDIRHLPKCDRRQSATNTTTSHSLHRVRKASLIKNRDNRQHEGDVTVAIKTEEDHHAWPPWVDFRRVEPQLQEVMISHDTVSVETVEASAVTTTHLGLELTLG